MQKPRKASRRTPVWAGFPLRYNKFLHSAYWWMKIYHPPFYSLPLVVSLCFDFAQHHELVEWSNISREGNTKGESVALELVSNEKRRTSFTFVQDKQSCDATNPAFSKKRSVAKALCLGWSQDPADKPSFDTESQDEV